MATVNDLRQKPGYLFNPEDHPPTTQPLAKKNSRERTLTPVRTPQLVSLRQAYSSPWGVNIPPHRQAAPQSASPSSSPPSSSSLSSSSFSSAFRLSHFKSLSRLSIFNLANQPNQEHQGDCRVNSGPDLIQIHNRSLPSSIMADTPTDSSPRAIAPKTDNLKTLLMVNILKSSGDSPIPPNPSLDLNFKYPTSPSPARLITTPSSAHMTSLVNTLSSQSIIPADLLPSLHRAQSSPRSICSPLSLAGSPQLGSEPSSSPLSSQSQLRVHDKSLTPPSSPTHGSSPSNCQTCRFPLSRTSSESSVLLSLSYRSPLFDDFDEESAVSHTQEVSFNDERDQISRQPSICSSSPDSSHPLSTWWSDLPPHRRAHIIEAESWPIFTPSASLPILGSPLSGHCACSSLPSCEIPLSDDNLREQSHNPQDASHPSSSISTGSRPSFSTPNLNLLIPTPLDQNETDPLLSAHLSALDHITSSTTTETATGQTDPHSIESTSQPTRKKKRRGEESAPRSSESLLTKSLRRLSRKLPNIQWGNLSVRMNNNGQWGGSKTGEDGVGEEEPGEDENVLPSGVVDEDSSVELAGEDEKAQISRLVKSWTLDNIQPQNSLNGSFIVDPEMEWSSMMVQLETFSPDSNKKPHKLRTQTERKIPRRMRAEQHSRRSGVSNGDSTSMGRVGSERRGGMDGEDERSESEPVTGRDEKSAKRPQSRKRLSRNQQQKQQQRGINSSHDRKNSVKITRRVVSNPLHLLQLTLELEMMRQLKIKSPLKQRSMKLILTKLPPTSQNNEFEYISSPLRFEI